MNKLREKVLKVEEKLPEKSESVQIGDNFFFLMTNDDKSLRKVFKVQTVYYIVKKNSKKCCHFRLQFGLVLKEGLFCIAVGKTSLSWRLI